MFITFFTCYSCFEFSAITCIRNEESQDILGEKRVILLADLRTKLVSVTNFSSKQSIQIQK